MTETNKTKSRTSKPWGKTRPKGPWDTIVIGSGMGGMTTAAILSEVGERVLVLEQHYVPGGFTHTFKRPGYEWDVGVHAVGEVTSHSMTGRLLERLTKGRLQWASLGKVYDEFHFPDDFRIDFPDNPQSFRDALLNAFPKEQKAIDGYFAKVREVASGMKSYYKARAAPKSLGWLAERTLGRRSQRYLEMNTAEVVASLTDDPKLRAIFTAQWGYYGSPPSRSSFAIQALVVKHFAHGGYYPVGGSGEIARQLLQGVADRGGWTSISADVERIIVESGRAVGVCLQDGQTLRAKRIVSAVGVLSTVERLLHREYSDAPWVNSIKTLTPSAAHVCLHLGFKGNIREAGAGAANKWFYDTWDMETDIWDISRPEELPGADVLYCSFPSLKDPQHDPGPEQRHTGEIVTFVPWETFAQWEGSQWMKRGEAYDTFKGQLEQRLLTQFLERMPALKPMVDHVELSTPLSTDKFCRPIHGAIYGIEPTPARFQNPYLKPRSPITGLYFSGSDVSSVGVVGAMMGGLLAAMAARPLATARLLKQL